jgi:hypothetical protein
MLIGEGIPAGAFDDACFLNFERTVDPFRGHSIIRCGTDTSY